MSFRTSQIPASGITYSPDISEKMPRGLEFPAEKWLRKSSPCSDSECRNGIAHLPLGIGASA